MSIEPSSAFAPSRPTSSATVISSSSGPCGSDSSSASAIIAAIATPSSAPSVVPSAVSQSPSRTSAIRPSAGSFGLDGSRSHTMSRCPWRMSVGADSRPALAGTRITRFRPASCRSSNPCSSAHDANVLDDRLLVTRRARDRRQGLEVRPEGARLEPCQRCLSRTAIASTSLRASFGYASAFCLIASNSACVIAPLSRSCFAFSISAAAPPLDGRLADVLVELVTLRPRPLQLALGHPDVLRDQVDEDAEERQEDREDDPAPSCPGRRGRGAGRCPRRP